MMYRSGTLAHVNTLSEVLKLLKERLGGRGTILQMLNCLYGVLSRELEFSIVKTVGHFFLQNLRYISLVDISMTIGFSYISHVYVLMTISFQLGAKRLRSSW